MASMKNQAWYRPYLLSGVGTITRISLYGPWGELDVGRGWFEAYDPDRSPALAIGDVIELEYEGDIARRKSPESGKSKRGHFYVCGPETFGDRGYHVWLWVSHLDIVREEWVFDSDTHSHYQTLARVPLRGAVLRWTGKDKREVVWSDSFVIVSARRSEEHEEGKKVLAIQASLKNVGVDLSTYDVAKIRTAFELVPKAS